MNDELRETGQLKKKRSLKKTAMIIVCVLLCILICLAAAYFIMKAIGAKKLREEIAKQSITGYEDAELEAGGKIVTYRGKKYKYNEDLVTILVMGIDKELEETGEDTIGANGQADMLMLAVLDPENGKTSLINISRDSMVDVNKYNVRGEYLGTQKMQVCLSYAYGDGKEKSCINTVESVSRLMYGMPINAYAALDYSGISVLNDAVGGVTVEVLEDFSFWDSTMKKGNVVKLKGEQAHAYVRSRDTELLDSNNSRMQRQRQYMLAFISTAMSAVRKDFTLPLTLYREMSDYTVTDIRASEITYLASLMLKYGFSEQDMRSIPGEVVKGEKYAEFIPDEEKMFELILDVFYNEVNNPKN